MRSVLLALAFLLVSPLAVLANDPPQGGLEYVNNYPPNWVTSCLPGTQIHLAGWASDDSDDPPLPILVYVNGVHVTTGYTGSPGYDYWWQRTNYAGWHAYLTLTQPGANRIQVYVQDSSGLRSQLGSGDWTIQVNAPPNQPPTGSLSVLDANHSVLGTGPGAVPLSLGSQFYIRITGNDTDGSWMRFFMRWRNPAGSEMDLDNPVSSGSWSQDYGPFTADQVGTWPIWGHIEDAGGLWCNLFAWDNIGQFSLSVTDPRQPPSIYSQPQSTVATVDEPNSLSVAASGIPDPGYQWYKDGVPIAGATASTLYFPNPQKSDEGQYQAYVSNSVGSAYSSTAALRVVHPVLLSSYTFSAANPPTISTAEPMPARYRLRMKLWQGGVEHHLATTWQNNQLPIDSVPASLPPGTYSVDLYWLKYDDSGSTLLEIGPLANSNRIVTFLASPPPAPVAQTASGLSQTSFTANWSGVANASSYQLDVAFDPGFSAFVPLLGNLNVGLSITWVVNGLSAGSNYYYRIRAVGAGGTSANSNVVHVSTSKLPQTITFNLIPNKLSSAPPFAPAVTASSGLPITLTCVSGPATLSGSTVILTGGTGMVTLRASQPGNASYEAAAAVDMSFIVTASTQADSQNLNQLDIHIPLSQ
jgi:hypothetical protein